MKAHLGRIASILLFALAAFASPAVLAQSNLDFTVENQTGFVFKELYLSPVTKDNWGKQILSSPIPDKGTRNIKFKPTVTATVFDMRVVYADGKAVFWRELDLTKFNRLVLKWDKATGKTSIVKKKA